MNRNIYKMNYADGTNNQKILEKMKILVCASEYIPLTSGIGNVVYNIVEQFKSGGVDCAVCSPIGSDIELCNRTLTKNFFRFSPIFFHLYSIIYFWYKASKYIKRNHNKYDILWLHNPNPISFKGISLKKALITVHTTKYGYPSHSLYTKIMSKLEKKFYNNIDCRFTVVSQQVCKELEEIGIAKQRITYIPNGVDIKLFKPSDNKMILRKKFAIPEDDLIFLSLGRLTEAKQPLKLIEVFSEIEKEKKDVSLVIAGKGELLDKTKEFVRQKKLKNVIFLGYVDEEDITDLYACSDYYIMTSKYEGQPLTLLEAMASGLPCIVSDISNLRIVEDARCGIVVDFEDVEKATEEITEYLKRENFDHSRNAREYALNNLDWGIIAGRYLEEFKEISE